MQRALKHFVFEKAGVTVPLLPMRKALLRVSTDTMTQARKAKHCFFSLQAGRGIKGSASS